MLLFISPHLLKHITFLINHCLITGTFPDAWKVAYVVPIPKVSNPSKLNDFRPISILPVLSKLLERVVANQLTTYSNLNKILPACQSGFRKCHSTTTALLQVNDDIFRAWDSNLCTCLILLDFSKAFDTIEHKLLLTKLKYYGLGDIALRFFQSYLLNRKQSVSYNSLRSEIKTTEQGVPQGSVLGPLLFCMYTADFSEFLNHFKSHQFADDTQVYYSFNPNNIPEACREMNTDLQMIHDVSKAHRLVLNENKTQLIVFGKSREIILNDQRFLLTLNDIRLDPKVTCKNLGLLIDSDLRFSSHVSALIRKSFGRLRLLYMHREAFDVPTRLRLCDSLVLSYLNYCNVVYMPCLTQRDHLRLQKIQNACLRFCYDVRKFEHITPHLIQSGWLSIRERYQLHLVCLVFKIRQMKLPDYLYQKLNTLSEFHVEGSVETRHGGLFSVPRHNNEFFKRCFSYTATHAFNSLPTNIGRSSSLISFRKGTKDHLLSVRNLLN